MVNGLPQVNTLLLHRLCAPNLRRSTFPVLTPPDTHLLHAGQLTNFPRSHEGRKNNIHLPNHCSPAWIVAAGTPPTSAGAPRGTNASCHLIPLRLCVQIENAPFPLERPRLIIDRLGQNRQDPERGLTDHVPCSSSPGINPSHWQISPRPEYPQHSEPEPSNKALRKFSNAILELFIKIPYHFPDRTGR